MRRAALVVALVLAGCGAAFEARSLETLGVRARAEERGWFELRSDAGYRFEMPGVPHAEPEEYALRGQLVRAIFYDLRAEMSSRGFRVRAFDAGELDGEGREAVRVQAEAQAMRIGEQVSGRRELVEDGVTVHEAIVEPVTMHGHIAIVRTFVRGRFVFQLIAVVMPGGGRPDDAYRFFRSVHVRGEAPPVDPALIPAEAPDD